MTTALRTIEGVSDELARFIRGNVPLERCSRTHAAILLGRPIVKFKLTEIQIIFSRLIVVLCSRSWTADSERRLSMRRCLPKQPRRGNHAGARFTRDVDP